MSWNVKDDMKSPCKKFVDWTAEDKPNCEENQGESDEAVCHIVETVYVLRNKIVLWWFHVERGAGIYD